MRKKSFNKSNTPKKTNDAPRRRLPNPDGKTIYIGNLLYDIDEKSLYGIFGKFGKVKYVHVVNTQGKEKSKGIAFVDMYQVKDADRAIEQLNGRVIAGRTVKVSEAVDRPKIEVKKPKFFSESDTIKKTKEQGEDDIIFKKKKKRTSGLQQMFENIGKRE